MKTSSRLIALSVLLAAAVFLLDISIPLGVAGGVPYVVIVLVTMWSPKREFTIIMAVTGTVLTMAGFLLSPAGGEMWKVVINRLLALFAIWVTAVLILYHKRAETQIIESAKSLARAQEIANVGSWNYDIASKNVTWSDQLYRIYGFGPKEVTLTFQAFKNYIHPDDRDRVNNAIEVALKNEKPYDIDFRIVRKDGTQRVIHSQGEVEFDQEGRPIRMYGVAGDVTERKQAEEKLQKLNKAVEHTGEMVIITDTDGTIEYVNPAFEQNTGYTKNEAIGKNPRILKSGVHDTAFYKDMWGTIKSGKQWYGEMTNKKKSGEIYIEEMTVSPIVDSKGLITNFVAIKRNVTERKRAEEKLRLASVKLAKANEEIKGFANIVSHDLRSPLVNIKGFSEELKSSWRKLTGILSEASPRLTREQNKLIREVMKEEIPEAFGFIDSSANAMEKLVSSIMALARIGVRKMIPVEVDVAGLINEKLRSMHHQVEDKNVDVKVNSLPSVVADLMSLDQIFGNIFSNSIKYLDPGRPGVIEISGERRSGDTLYKVEDNGIGIPDYGKDKVFVLFRRVVGKDIPGEGMGLAYVKALVERHDGEIWFESQEGKGTTVFFTIPDDIMTLGETNGKS